jgi:2-dehydropantoate 2-reductase
VSESITIVGAGAIGGLIGARLASVGCHVSALARGDTARALAAHGWRLQDGERVIGGPAHVVGVDQAASLGPQSIVIIALKATAMPQLAAQIAPLIGPETVVVTAMNGVPWWFFQGFGGPCEGMALESVDPGGVTAHAIPPSSIVGAVVHLSCSSVEPGMVRLASGNRLILGEPSRTLTPRLQVVADLLSRAGFVIETTDRIHDEIWYKLWGNMTINPISAFTGATGDRILDDPLVNQFCLDVMAEAKAIGARFGCTISQSGLDRNRVTRQLGALRTSMWRDVVAGRPIELDALVGVVREIAQRLGEPTPSMDVLLGLARLHGRVHGLYPEAPPADPTA